MESEERAAVKKKSISRLSVFAILAILCGACIYFVLTLPSPEKGMEKESKTGKGLPVSVRTVKPESHAAVVTALGEVLPKWETNLLARVDGKVVHISPHLEEGAVVKKDEVLVQTERSALEMQAAEARSRLASAKTALLTEEQEAQEAQGNWVRSGLKGSPGSPLVLHGPQLEAAAAEVEAAQAALRHAMTLLDYTEIRAPFDGIVVETAVNPGDVLFAGDQAARLFSRDAVKIRVHLDAAQWDMLPDPVSSARAALAAPERKAVWKARIVGENWHLNKESRLRTLHMQVDAPLKQHPPLFPGSFVRVEIHGREVSGVLAIPESALTMEGIVWFVDQEERLQPHATQPVFWEDGCAYIKAPDRRTACYRVALTPNGAFLKGQKVQPLEKAGGE